MSGADENIPESVQELIEDFHAVPDADRLQLLLEFSRSLPDLPERYGEHPEQLEQVVECQSPLFLAVEVEGQEDGAGGGEPAGPESVIRLFITAPAEAPTTRGFASVLSQGLDGLTAAEILAVPDDIPNRLGLANALTPLRLRGMSAMLGRIKRNVKNLTGRA